MEPTRSIPIMVQTFYCIFSSLKATKRKPLYKEFYLRFQSLYRCIDYLNVGILRGKPR